MRIVLSNSSSKWGGVHTVAEILAKGLVARGHDVRIFGYPGSMLEEKMRALVPFDPILKGADFHPVVLWRAARRLRHYGTEIVLTMTKKDVSLTGIAAYATGIPVVIRHPNQQPLGRDLRVRFVYGRVPSMHITNAEATRQTLLESAPWLSPEKVKVFYNGVDAELFAHAEPLALGLDPGSTAIGFVGSFEGRKGVRELARAWRTVAEALPRANLILCGKGSLEGEMRRILEGEPRVHWLEYRKSVASLLRALDVLVLPSHVEGAPNIVLEAMAAGVAVVATGVSGTPELVRNGIEARLIPPGDERALINAIVEVASNPQLRQSFTAAGRKRVREKFTIDGMVDAYERLLADVIGSRRASL